MLELVIDAASPVIALWGAIFVMYRTNRSNKAISDKANRISVAMEITQMTSKFCLSALQLRSLCLRHNEFCERRQREPNLGQFEVLIDNLNTEIGEKEDEIRVLLFNLEIIQNTHNALKSTMNTYEKIQEIARQGYVDGQKIQKPLSDLRAEVGGRMKEYIG